MDTVLIVFLQDYRIKEESVSTFPEVNYDIHRVRYTYKLWYANIKTQKIRHNPPPPQTPPQSVDLFKENTPYIFLLEYIFGLYELTHRVDRVLGFLELEPPPPPSGVPRGDAQDARASPLPPPVHPPPRPCASPPSPAWKASNEKRWGSGHWATRKNASLFTCDLIICISVNRWEFAIACWQTYKSEPGEAEGRQQETCKNFADTISCMCKVPVVLYFLCYLFKLWV